MSSNRDIMMWANIVESIEHGDIMTQEELTEYVKTQLGDEWVKVMKTACIKVIEQAQAGKEYETITRDEDGGEWKETKNKAKEGDYLIQNAYGSDKEPDEQKDPSKWLLSVEKIKKNYQVRGEVEVGQSYSPNKVMREGIELKESIRFIASWGQEMKCRSGDWLVKAGENDIYRVEKVVFQNTYSIEG